jgi:hypothetical protein
MFQSWFTLMYVRCTNSVTTVVLCSLRCGTEHLHIALYCDMMPESRNSPLLDNASVNTFSRLHSQQWDLRCLVAGCYIS